MSSTRIYLLLISLALSGCASTQRDSNPRDPLEPINRSVYKFNESVDKAIFKPVAKGYNTVMPERGKVMVRNFFSNLDDVLVTINEILQLKFAQAASDGTRVLFNSTFGILGLINVTDRLEKHNEDFGQTLGYWGVGSGPYVVLPFFGPRTVRDSVGLYVDSYASPIRLIPDIPTRNELYATRIVSLRAELLEQEGILDEAAIDRYAFIRDAYLQQRQSLVYDGNPPREKFDDDNDLPNKDSTEDTKESTQQPVVAVSASTPQHSMEPPTTPMTSEEPASGTQPANVDGSANSPFNPYRMEQPMPVASDKPEPN